MYPMSFDVCGTGLTVQAANMGPPPPVKTVISRAVLEGLKKEMEGRSDDGTARLCDLSSDA